MPNVSPSTKQVLVSVCLAFKARAIRLRAHPERIAPVEAVQLALIEMKRDMEDPRTPLSDQIFKDAVDIVREHADADDALLRSKIPPQNDPFQGNRILIFHSPEDDGFIADIPSLKYCSAFGDTPEEALQQIAAAIRLWNAGQRCDVLSKRPLSPSSPIYKCRSNR